MRVKGTNEAGQMDYETLLRDSWAQAMPNIPYPETNQQTFDSELANLNEYSLLWERLLNLNDGRASFVYRVQYFNLCSKYGITPDL